MQPRILLTTLPALALGACFDPALDLGDDGTATGGSTTDPATAGSTTDPDTDDQADSTGATDAPPVITAFTVNSSTTPPEQQISGMVAFDVDAMDDVDIDRIEIYDGDTLVTTVTEIPYRTELLLTSADNGSHAYSAVAFDTAGQTAESEVVPLSVNIVGGELLTLREDIGDVQSALFGIGAPKITPLPNGDIVLTGMARLESVPVLHTGLLVRGYSMELGLLWSDEHEPSIGSMATDYRGFSAPSIGASGQIAYVGGTVELSAGESELTAFSFDTQTGALTGTNELWLLEAGVGYLPIAVDSSGDVFASTADAEVARYSQDFSMEYWRSNSLGASVFELASTSRGEAMVLFTGIDCAPGATICLGKLSAEGDVLWTRPVSEDAAAGAPTRPTTSSDGHVAVAHPVDDGTTLISVFDAGGSELASITLDNVAALYPLGATYTPAGDLVVVGISTQLEDSTAWATRVREDGNVLWDQTYEIGTSGSVVSGVAVSPSGRLYASGHADPFDSDLVSYGAHAWIAELAW